MMGNQTTESSKPTSLKDQIFEGIKLIVSICIVGGLIYGALYYNKTHQEITEEDPKLEIFQKQSEVLQKHISTNDSILFHLINENKCRYRQARFSRGDDGDARYLGHG